MPMLGVHKALKTTPFGRSDAFTRGGFAIMPHANAPLSLMLAPSLTMNKLSGKAAELTRQEWRDLGFYYISSTEQQKWILHGSKVGLLNLCKLVEEFAAKNHPLGEHDHLLPHWYLTLTSCDTFSINSRGISGTPKQLNEFAKIFTKSVQNSSKGTTSLLSKDVFSSEYAIEYTVHGDNYDPSSKDPQL